jgi:trk system potassium uptake protein TrkA
MPIDVIISPEIEIAQAVSRRLQVPGAIDMIPFADDRIRVIAVRIDEGCPIADTPLRQLTELFPDLQIRVMGIIRDGEVVMPRGQDEMKIGDEVYFAVETTHLTRAMAAFGHEEKEARRVIIVGGGNIGLFLAQALEADHPNVMVKLIEIDPERAHFVAQQLTRTVVLNGDALQRELLEEANVQATETVIAVANDDEVNILSSLLAKRYGCTRAVTLINNASYAPLITSLGIDVVVDPRAITVSRILEHVRRGRIRSVHSLPDGLAEVIEAEALETSPLVGAPLRDIDLPPGMLVGAVARGDEVIIPRGDTVIQVHDRLVMFTVADTVKQVEKMFAVRLEFF